MRKTIDMTQGKPLGLLLRFAAPLMHITSIFGITLASIIVRTYLP